MSRVAVVAVALLALAAVVGPVTVSGTAAPSAPATGSHPTVPAAAATATPPPPATPTARGRSGPAIAGVYPNPVADGDRGEFVLLTVPSGTSLGAYRLTDDEESVQLPSVSVSGRVAVTSTPGLVRNLTDARVIEATVPTLANGGEPLALRRANRTVTAVRYRDAPEGRLARFDARGTVTWHPLGRTNFSVVAGANGSARAFVLPDAPDVPVETLRDADDRLLLAGYTFTSRRVARALERAVARGVDVRLLLEGDPVDGITRREARLLDSLVEAGVSVRLLGGPRRRYAFHHAKYAVADDRAVVLTENWKPAGAGGHGSRGWGVVVDQPRVVRGLARAFRADANWTAATPWRQFRRGRSFTESGVANGTFPSERAPETVPVDRTRLLVTPDNAGRVVTRTIDRATESVDVIQMRIDGPDQRFLRATVRAARRGVDVRVLLSSAWYVREENRRLVERLRERADAENLPLRAKLADPRGRYEKIHAKGLVVDGDQALVGSLNWNEESVERNREVLVLLDGDQVGSYYQRAFEADWGSPGPSLPVGSAVAVAGVVVLAVLVLRRVEFGTEVGVGPG